LFLFLFLFVMMLSVSEGAKEVGDSSPTLQRKECITHTHTHINARIADLK
jgi:hypothetical protein